MTVTVLVPAFNEEAVIERFVASVAPVLEPGWELLVIDDGSTDGTPELLRKLAAGDPRVRVLGHEANRGMGAALATGFRAARGEVIVAMDADLSHPPELITRLVAACRDADAAFASRYVPGGGMRGIPLRRVAVSRLGNLVLRTVFASPVRDLTTGFRAYRAEAVRTLELEGTGFEAQLEISVGLLARGRRVVEVPLLLTDRAAGASKMRYVPLARRYGRMMLRLLGVRWRRPRPQRAGSSGGRDARP